MSVLEFVRGPLLAFSLLVLFGSTAWRIAGVLRAGRRGDLSVPRGTQLARGALGNIGRRMWPRRELGLGRDYGAINGYLYHIGLVLIVFGFLPHIRFVERLTGLSWPALPEAVVYAVTGVTIVVLLLVLHHRRSDPVKRMLSGFDDYFSWFVVFVPLLTGMIVMNNWQPAPHPGMGQQFDAPIVVHLLSVELLFVWLPFGKLGHAFLVFFSRGFTGAATARKGAAR